MRLLQLYILGYSDQSALHGVHPLRHWHPSRYRKTRFRLWEVLIPELAEFMQLYQTNIDCSYNYGTEA